jgi:XTP/dITP diphosphohydrolase
VSQAIVLASNNRGKLAELSQILAPFGLTIYPLAHFTSDSVEETGATFRDNALLKARFAARATNMAAVADDSGLEVDALDGAPGVYSARYAGERAHDAANNAKLLAALSGTPESARAARFRCVLAYVRDADSEPVFAEGVWEGSILDVPRGVNGFGYDPLFLPSGGRLSAAEMTTDEKNRVSHRARALRTLAEQLFVNAETSA